MSAASDQFKKPDTIIVDRWVEQRNARREAELWCVVQFSNMRGGEHTKIVVSNETHELLRKGSYVEGAKEWGISVIIPVGPNQADAESVRTLLSGPLRGAVSKAVWAGEVANHFNYPIYGTFDTIFKTKDADEFIERVLEPLGDVDEE